MGHRETIEIVIIKKCPKVLRMYGKELSAGMHMFSVTTL